jgi:hypothetical protein
VQLKRQSDVEEDMEDEVATFSESELPRELYYSPVYKGKNNIPLLIFCNSMWRRCELPARCRLTGERQVESVAWSKKLSASTIWNYNKTLEGNRFFLWKHLGRGASVRSFLACDSTGGAYVLKFFLYDDNG